MSVFVQLKTVYVRLKRNAHWQRLL